MMSSDALFPNVALLLTGQSFMDLSYNRVAVSQGPVTLTNAFAGIYPTSYWFQRTFTGITFSMPHPTAARITAGRDFCLEIIAYVQKNQAGGALFSNRTAGGTANGFLLGLDGSGRAFVRVSSGGVLRIAIDSPNKLVLNALHTFKVYRKAGRWGLMIDGVPQRDTVHQPIWDQEVPHGNSLYLGCDPYTTGFVGGINGVRLTMGDARGTDAYVPSIQPWPTFATEANITFGVLSRTITQASAAVVLDVEITNAASVSVSAVNGAGEPIVGNWSITAFPQVSQNNWRIQGTPPAALADFFLVLTATSTAQFGSLTKSNTYRLSNTATGSLSAKQRLLNSLGNLRLWLDANDSTTRTLQGQELVQILNKANSVAWVAAPGRPRPTIDTSSMQRHVIRFPETSASALVATTPEVLTDQSSNSTIIMVGRYVGQQQGQGAGLFQISYNDATQLADRTATWQLRTQSTGVANAQISMYDSANRQNGVGTAPVIQPGESFIVVWNTASNKADIWFRQNKAAEIELSGSLAFWESANAVIGFIGAALSPNGSMVCLGEIIALAGDLTAQDNEANLKELSNFLNSEWGIYTPAPFATTPSVLSGYVSNPYAATLRLVNATSATVTASGGSNWQLTSTGSAVADEYLLTGMLPSNAGSVTIVINTLNGNVAGSDDYVINVQQLPNTPVIQAPQNLQAQAGSGYASLLNIFNADTVGVSASAGYAWQIQPAPEAESGNYVITGIAPDEVGSFYLTVTATKTISGVVVNAQEVFSVSVGQNFVEEPPQYPMDLTGLLQSNKITREKQTLSVGAGLSRQIVIPLFAPYFEQSMIIEYRLPNGQRAQAVKSQDYVCTGFVESVSNLAQADIYTSLLILNPHLFGTIELTYQTLGSGFSVDRRAVMAQLYQLSRRGAFYGWGAVTGKPVFFPAQKHTLNIQKDTVGFSQLSSALQAVRSSLTNFAESDLASLIAHAQLSNNPHGITKQKLNLGNVQNYPIATDTEAASGTSNQRYVTPKSAYLTIDANIPLAQNTSAGKFRLNLGNLPGDDTDATKPLTGAGVVALLNSPVPNALNGLFLASLEQAELPVQATPAPLVYPLWWKGLRCNNEREFVSAVRSFTGIRNLRYNSQLGVFYFPLGMTPPSLVTKQAFSNVGAVRATVKTPVALPLLLTD